MDDSQLLVLRQQARAAKAGTDAALLALHRQAAEALAGPRAEFVRGAALSRVAQWESGRLCSSHYIALWRNILGQPLATARDAMLQADGEGPALRQNTPFSFLMRG
jgi:hypothetical protein